MKIYSQPALTQNLIAFFTHFFLNERNTLVRSIVKTEDGQRSKSFLMN